MAKRKYVYNGNNLKEANRLLEREVKQTQQQLTDARIRIKELLKEMSK